MFPDIIGNNRYFNDCLVIQTFILMALLGGVYVPCIIGLLPDKKRETYDVFFGLIHAYLDVHQLPNTFADGFFMTDFEVNIRNAFSMFWPDVRMLGCYFHFSQLVWRRVKSRNIQLILFVCLCDWDNNDKVVILVVIQVQGCRESTRVWTISCE